MLDSGPAPVLEGLVQLLIIALQQQPRMFASLFCPFGPGWSSSLAELPCRGRVQKQAKLQPVLELLLDDFQTAVGAEFHHAHKNRAAPRFAWLFGGYGFL